MKNMNYTKELQIAIEAVSNASKLCANVQYALVANDTLEKADRSPVTIADFGSQAVVNLILGNKFPKDAYVCEEDADELRKHTSDDLKAKIHKHTAAIFPDVTERAMLDAIDLGQGECDFKGRYWTLDPIDGTKGFLRGDQYAIALGLVEDGELVLGVLGCPNLYFNPVAATCDKGVIFYAVKGNGAYALSLNSDEIKEIHVDAVSSPEKTVFCESVESAHTAHGKSARIAEYLGVTAEPYRIDSQCKYAAVARGDASVYLRLPTIKGYQEKIWDHAAGAVIVEEAGGKVTDINGKPLDFSMGRQLTGNSGIVATNGILHDVFIDAILRS